MRTMTMWASYLFEEEWLLLIYSRKNEVLFEELWYLFREYVSVVIRCWRRLKKMSAIHTIMAILKIRVITHRTP